MDSHIENRRDFWKSSHSSSSNNNCVEVFITADKVFVRDSKNPQVPPLTFTHPEWEAFRLGVLDGEFDL
jgi:Domain of unknown function (DUF397)